MWTNWVYFQSICFKLEGFKLSKKFWERLFVYNTTHLLLLIFVQYSSYYTQENTVCISVCIFVHVTSFSFLPHLAILAIPFFLSPPPRFSLHSTHNRFFIIYGSGTSLHACLRRSLLCNCCIKHETESPALNNIWLMSFYTDFKDVHHSVYTDDCK